MKKRLFAGVIALLMTAGMAFVASTATADPEGKVWVTHNGHDICVSRNAYPAHLAHGDPKSVLKSCSVKKKAKKKIAKKKK